MDCLTIGQYMQPTKRHIKVNFHTYLLCTLIKPVKNLGCSYVIRLEKVQGQMYDANG